jgi:hypothetical protein
VAATGMKTEDSLIRDDVTDYLTLNKEMIIEY